MACTVSHTVAPKSARCRGLGVFVCAVGEAGWSHGEWPMAVGRGPVYCRSVSSLRSTSPTSLQAYSMVEPIEKLHRDGSSRWSQRIQLITVHAQNSRIKQVRRAFHAIPNLVGSLFQVLVNREVHPVPEFTSIIPPL